MRDTVFINDNLGGYVNHFPVSLAYEVENPSVVTPVEGGPEFSGETFGVALFYIDDVPNDSEPDTLDLVTVGSGYGIRVFLYNPDAVPPEFEFAAYYHDGHHDGYRGVDTGDVDGDGDIDIVVSRINVGSPPAEPNRVWFNKRNDSNWDPDDPFVMSNQPPLQLPELDTVSWILTSGAPPCASGSLPVAGKGTTFESALGDLDEDGDLDLVCTSYFGRAGAYVNNGYGFFGCLDEPTTEYPYNDGLPAFAFSRMTDEWVGDSDCLRWRNNSVLPEALELLPGCGYQITIPGTLLESCTGVELKDLNNDGRLEVAFSNRGDLEDICAHQGFDYLDDNPANPVDPVYDYVYYNTSSPGNLSFANCVEAIGVANDGTGYGEFASVNRTSDYKLDWVDANFSNDEQGSINNLYWGNTLVPFGCAVIGMSSMGAQVELSLTGMEEMAGLPYYLFASATGVEGKFKFAGADVPLSEDALTDLFGDQAEPYPGAAGVLDKDGNALIQTIIPPSPTFLTGAPLWFVAVIVKDDLAVLVSNPVDISVIGF